MKPFDLEAAKRGEPIQTCEGELVTFIAHVPNATPKQRVLVLDSTGGVWGCHENGQVLADFGNACDIFMAPKKRTVWLNLYPTASNKAYVYDTQESADAKADNTRIGGKAWPLEIEE